MSPALRCGLGVHQQRVGDRPVGDVDLAAVENVVAALATRRGAHGTQRIGPRPGLGKS